MKIIRKIVIFSIVTSIAAGLVLGATISPAAAAPEAATCSSYYTVAFGDTLAIIGARLGVSWVAIAQANGLVNPSLIYTGQVLCIPAAGTYGTGGPYTYGTGGAYNTYGTYGYGGAYTNPSYYGTGGAYMYPYYYGTGGTYTYPYYGTRGPYSFYGMGGSYYAGSYLHRDADGDFDGIHYGIGGPYSRRY